jgi:hypothetical protein
MRADSRLSESTVVDVSKRGQNSQENSLYHRTVAQKYLANSFRDFANSLYHHTVT